MDKFKVVDSRIVPLGSLNEYEGQGLQWTLRRGDKIIDSSSEPTSLTTDTAGSATASSDVVDKLAQAILKARASKSVSVPAGAEPSDADKLAQAMLEARTKAR
jgi:hypothetical protein